MAKKLEFRKIRSDNRRQPERPEDQDRRHLVLEPVDIALLAVIVLLVFWLQWLMGTLAT
jgi:hypothetical protein